jgi:hypothetical protein
MGMEKESLDRELVGRERELRLTNRRESMLLSESVMFGTVLADQQSLDPLLVLALKGQESRAPQSDTAALVTEFIQTWPWSVSFKVVAPEWSSRRMTLATPAEHFGAIFDDEVRTGKVQLEQLVSWIQLLENAIEVEVV